MPYLSKRAFAKLQQAGNEMSNICFNLSQHDGQKAADLMRTSQRAWDAALEAARHEITKRHQERILKSVNL